MNNPNDVMQASAELLKEAQAAIEQFNILNGYIQYQKQVGQDSPALQEAEKNLLGGESSLHYRNLVELGNILVANSDDMRKAMKDMVDAAVPELKAEINENQYAYILNFRQNLQDATASMQQTNKECQDALKSIERTNRVQQKILEVQEKIQPIVDKAKAIPGWIKNFVKGTNEIVKQAGKDVFKKASRFSDIQLTKLKGIEKVAEQAKMRQAEVKMKYHELQCKAHTLFYNAKINAQEKLMSIVSPGQQFDVTKMKDTKHPELIAQHKRAALDAKAEMAQYAANIAGISDYQMEKFRSLNHNYDRDIKGMDSFENIYNESPELQEQFKSAEDFARDFIKKDEMITVDHRIKNVEKYSPEQIQALSEAKDILTKGQMSMLFNPNLSVDKIRVATALAEMGFSNKEIRETVLNKDLNKDQLDKIFETIASKTNEQKELFTKEAVIANAAAEHAKKMSDKDIVDEEVNQVNDDVSKSTQEDPVQDDKGNVFPQRKVDIDLNNLDEKQINDLFSELAQNGVYGQQLMFGPQGTVSFVTASPEVAARMQNYTQDHNISAKTVDTVKSFTNMADKFADQMVQQSQPER